MGVAVIVAVAVALIVALICGGFVAWIVTWIVVMGRLKKKINNRNEASSILLQTTLSKSMIDDK